jgi:hypothetical protein
MTSRVFPAAAQHAWLRRVSDYHSGDVDDAERAAVEAHLATCVGCREALVVYRRFYALAATPSRLGAPSATPQSRSQSVGERIRAWASTPWRPQIPRRPPPALGGIAAAAAAIILVVSFLALIAPRLGERGPQPAATPTDVPPTMTPEATPVVTAAPTPIPFTCANPPAATSTYTFQGDDQQLYLVASCAAPVQLTRLDATKQRVIPQAFSPSNRWLMVTIRPSQAIEGTSTSPPWCQALIRTQTGALAMTTFCTAYWSNDWTEWPTFVGWLDDGAFLEAIAQRDHRVRVVRVDAATLAVTPVTTLTWVANMATDSWTAPSGILIRGDALYYGGYASTAEGGAWLHRYSLTTGTDTRLVRLGLAGEAGCQVAGPCDWTGPWDMTPDGGHIVYYSPGPTRSLSDTGDNEPATALYYARTDGSARVQMFAATPVGFATQPRLSPDGLSVLLPLRDDVVQPVTGGALITLPSGYYVSIWRFDSRALVLMHFDGAGALHAALFTLDGGAITPLPGNPQSYVWGT